MGGRDKAEAIASELLTTHPELRAGSFSNAIEEYVSFRLMEREILRKTELDYPSCTTFYHANEVSYCLPPGTPRLV